MEILRVKKTRIINISKIEHVKQTNKRRIFSLLFFFFLNRYFSIFMKHKKRMWTVVQFIYGFISHNFALSALLHSTKTTTTTQASTRHKCTDVELLLNIFILTMCFELTKGIRWKERKREIEKNEPNDMNEFLLAIIYDDGTTNSIILNEFPLFISIYFIPLHFISLCSECYEYWTRTLSFLLSFFFYSVLLLFPVLFFLKHYVIKFISRSLHCCSSCEH